MIIRHAEKPASGIAGVSMNGAQSDQELTVRGWQRSGALVRFFESPTEARLTTPKSIFASGAGPRSKSLRPQHTVSTLAEQLQLTLKTSHFKGEEIALADDALNQDGPVLICWQHEGIPLIVNRIVGNTTTCPQDWPGSRFDMVWVLDQDMPAGAWEFHQIPQLLLPGDSSAPIG